MLPSYQVAKRHSIEIDVPPEVVFPALCEHDLGDLKLTRILMRVRGSGSRHGDRRT